MHEEKLPSKAEMRASSLGWTQLINTYRFLYNKQAQRSFL